MKTTTKKRIRIPSVSVDAEVSLDEFDTSDIIQYLKDIGESGELESSDDGLFICESDLGRIETLALCGQTEFARSLALEIVGSAIGRSL